MGLSLGVKFQFMLGVSCEFMKSGLKCSKTSLDLVLSQTGLLNPASMVSG